MWSCRGRTTYQAAGAAEAGGVSQLRRHPHQRPAPSDLPVQETLTRAAPASRLRGRPPYGYRAVTGTVDGRQRQRLVPDDRTAPVVVRIFHEYLADKGLLSIAEGLTLDGISSPGAARRGLECRAAAWSKSAVRAILVNSRYAERTAIGDPGGEKSESVTIVAPEVFDRVQRMFDLRRTVSAANAGSAERFYALRGLVRCARCNRLMQGTWNNDEPYYRCRFPAEYASANEIDHPRNVYLREQSVVGPLTSWLRESCARGRLTQLVSTTRFGAHHEAAIVAAARRVRRLRESGGEEQASVFQELGLRLTYSAHDRMLQAKAVLGPAELVIRGSLAL
ncbi:recombinase family protein [Streptomyces sp. PH10-H1]|nr:MULTISPECIES: recombinase family protein [unclassified Streptomyces]MDJ0346549.1 recombinase family protein [Streptomyces sp. PH10-H1]